MKTYTATVILVAPRKVTIEVPDYYIPREIEEAFTEHGTNFLWDEYQPDTHDYLVTGITEVTPCTT